MEHGRLLLVIVKIHAVPDYWVEIDGTTRYETHHTALEIYIWEITNRFGCILKYD